MRGLVFQRTSRHGFALVWFVGGARAHSAAMRCAESAAHTLNANRNLLVISVSWSEAAMPSYHKIFDVWSVSTTHGKNRAVSTILIPHRQYPFRISNTYRVSAISFTHQSNRYYAVGRTDKNNFSQRVSTTHLGLLLVKKLGAKKFLRHLASVLKENKKNIPFRRVYREHHSCNVVVTGVCELF